MSLNKVNTTICGFFPSNYNFNYACYIAENLSNNLPNFSFNTILKSYSEWKCWLKATCKKNEWTHEKSPLIWRDSGIIGSKSIYIGGISEYKKFISQHYDVNVDLSCVELKNLKSDYSLIHDFMLMKNDFAPSYDSRIKITVIGTECSTRSELLTQLKFVNEFRENGLIINVYDVEDQERHCKSVNDDDDFFIDYTKNLSDALKDCDVLIILDYVLKKEFESTIDWLTRNYERIKDLGKNVDSFAPSSIKIIFCSDGPICFCANVMAKFVKKLYDKNQIVAIGSYHGTEMTEAFSQLLEIDLNKIGCSPVWGFLGINRYIDIFHTLQKCSFVTEDCNKKRTDCNTIASKSNQYKIEYRWLLYLISDERLQKKLFDRKTTCMYKDYHKCKAIIDLLKLWYKKDEIVGDEIVTLGICSDGTFGIPKNIYFSQPACIKILKNNSRIWIPCSEFPFPIECPEIIINLIDTSKLILKRMNLIDDD